MDLYKLKWKTKYRADQVVAVFKLLGYNIRHKLKLEGDESFYYHMQRDLMRYIIHSNVEEEYLMEHGLLPEEPEEVLEPEQEPGLLREIPFIELALSPLEHGELTYVVQEAKVYEDHICLTIMKIDHWDSASYNFTMPYRKGDRYTDVVVDGLSLRFDEETRCLSVIDD